MQPEAPNYKCGPSVARMQSYEVLHIEDIRNHDRQVFVNVLILLKLLYLRLVSQILGPLENADRSCRNVQIFVGLGGLSILKLDQGDTISKKPCEHRIRIMQSYTVSRDNNCRSCDSMATLS